MQVRRRLGLVAAGGVLLASVWGAMPARPAQAAPAPPAGSWPFFRYDMQRTNRVPPAVASANITQPAIKWSYPVGGAPSAWVEDITGPGGLPDGQPEVIAWAGGRVRAFDPRTAQLLWMSDLLPGLADLLFAGDVDADGDVEVLAWARQATHWRVYALSGAGGQILSVIQEPPSDASLSLVTDMNGDGKIEMFESGYASGITPSVFTYAAGATAPQPAATLDFGGSPARRPAVGDVNGDGQREAVYAREGGSKALFVVNTGWTSTTQSIAVAEGLYPTTLLADVLPASPGAEIVSQWTHHADSALLALHQVGPAPGYVITPVWVLTRTNLASFASEAVVADLDGGVRELIWSYYDNVAAQWKTQVINGATGAVSQTLTGQALCHSGAIMFAEWLGYFYAVANVDGDAYDELLLCDRSGQDTAAATLVRVYDWSAGSLSLKWSTPVPVTLVGQALPSDRPDRTMRQPRFTADFDGNGMPDVLMQETNGEIVARQGDTGAEVRRFTPPPNTGCSVAYVGGVGNAGAAELLLSCNDGYAYYLDSAFQVQRRMYAASGVVWPYVVDTNGDAKNEVVLVTAQGLLQNLDPYTATQAAAPKVNWSRGSDVIPYWHPLNVDGAGLWEYPLVDASAAPTYTLVLLSKDPIGGAETVLASGTIPNAPAVPWLQAVGDFSAAAGQEMFVSLGWYPQGPTVMLRRSGTTLSPLWGVSATLQANATNPGAVGDADGDSLDDIAWGANGFSSAIVKGNTGGLIANSSMTWVHQPMLGDVDGDLTIEAIYAASADGSFRVAEYTPAFPIAFTRQIADSHGAAALADASLSEGGLEIVYRVGGVLGAMSGVNGNDIYTRALGMAFNTVTCQTDINTPASYLGTQLATLEALCPGAGRFGTIRDLAVADVDGDNQDEILAASENGYLYALNAENGSLRWAYNFYYPVNRVIAANVDTDPQLEVLVSVADGFLYALEQQSFAKPQSAWDGPSPVVNDDADVQVSQACYTGHWRATNDPFLGQPAGYRVALRDEGGALMTDGYLDVAHTPGATVMGVTLCANDPNPQRRLVTNLIPGRRYFLEVISYKGANASGPTFTDSILVANFGSLEGSTKAVTPETTTPGGTLTWQVVVRNSTAAASEAQVFDPIPMNTTYVPGSASATFGSVSYNAGQNRVEWSGNLAAGQAATITFQTQVASGFSGGLIQNTAQIVNLSSGLIIQRSAAASVGASNLSSAVKEVSKGQALLGDVLTYTLRVTNTGTLTASGVLVNDPLPAGVSYVAGSLSATGGSGSAAYSNVLNRVTWNGSLGPGQVLEVRFRVQVNVANGVVDNCARFTDVVNGTFERCARTVVGSGGPSLVGSAKTSDRAVYSTTDTIVYTVTLANSGTQAATVQMRDDMPAGVTVQTAGALPSVGTLSYTSNRVTWSGSLAPGDVLQVRIVGNLNRSDGVMVNRAVVTDVTSARVYTLTREVVVGTAPSLNLEKYAEPASVDVGEEITYVLRLENTGNSVATGAVLTDALPSGTSYVAGSAAANVGSVSYNGLAQRLEWSGPVYITGPTYITWRVKVEAGAEVGAPVVNVASSYDGVSDYDTDVALTAVNVPAGKALIRAYVYLGPSGATPMSGVQVSAAGLATATANTNASGYANLLVDALATPTNYAVFQIVPSGYVNLTPNPVGVVGVTSGGVYEVVFRNAAQAPAGYGWVRGVVFNDANGDGLRNIFSEVGLANVMVSASDGQSMATNGDGSYYFLLPAGGRTLTQTNLVGWVSTTPDVVALTVASQGAHEVNFGDWQCLPGSPLCDPVPDGYARIYGYVYRDADATLNAPDGLKGVDDQGLALVEVWGDLGVYTDTTDASGLYFFDVPVGLVEVSLPNPPAGTLMLTPQSVGVSAPEGGYVRVDFGVISSTVCGSGFGVVNGYVYSDTLTNGQFLIGVDGPTLTQAAVTLGSQTQHTNWMYAFACVPTGSQTVASTNPAGYTNTTPNSVAATVSDGQATTVNFGKAFQNVPIALKYAYVPIVMKP